MTQNDIQVLGLIFSTMASKRPQDECGSIEKKKKKCEETVVRCSVVEDEQVKRAVKEAWSQRSHYKQGQYRRKEKHTYLVESGQMY